eukprot:3686338-Heterocapsa_arctica.AAC.2
MWAPRERRLSYPHVSDGMTRRPGTLGCTFITPLPGTLGVATTYLTDADSVHPPLVLETQRQLEVKGCQHTVIREE